MSTSAVSQHLRALESASGVVLLNRSTRKLSLTEAGRRIAEHCRSMVAAAEAAQQQLSLAQEAPTGQLRLSAPQGFARHIAPALSPLLSEHPGLSLHLLLADEMIDLIEARIDLALRAGKLADSGWVARRLCELECVLCAAPGPATGDPVVTFGTGKQAAKDRPVGLAADILSPRDFYPIELCKNRPRHFRTARVVDPRRGPGIRAGRSAAFWGFLGLLHVDEQSCSAA